MVSFPIGLQFAIYQHPRARLPNLKMIIFFLFLNVSEVDLKEPPVCRGVNYLGSQLSFVSFRWYEQSPKKDSTLLLPAVKKEPCADTTANIVQITLKFPWFSMHLAPGERHSSSEVIYSVTSAHSAIMTTISFWCRRLLCKTFYDTSKESNYSKQHHFLFLKCHPLLCRTT